MIVYKVTNVKSNRNYYGITNSFQKRKAAHKYSSKESNKHSRGCKSPFYDAIRSYGWENFKWEIIFEGTVKEAVALEIKLISEDTNCYNLHQGGSIGFSINNKSNEEIKQWKIKLSIARKNKKPSLGMKHTEENKKLFAEISNNYWNIHRNYFPEDIKNLTFKEANLKLGISKTHYYRLKKRLRHNESQ
jgi:group I intron endonuclease